MLESTVEKITAKPGTPEYQKQFERQSRSAFDSFLQLWIMRSFSAFLGVLCFIMSVVLFFEYPEKPLTAILASATFLPFGIQCIIFPSVEKLMGRIGLTICLENRLKILQRLKNNRHGADFY
jgi:hypothetical protein